MVRFRQHGGPWASMDRKRIRSHPSGGGLFVFTNYYGFLLHDPKMKGLADLFWEQMERIKPLSYIADGSSCLSFVTSNAEQFSAVAKALASLAAESEDRVFITRWTHWSPAPVPQGRDQSRQ